VTYEPLTSHARFTPTLIGDTDLPAVEPLRTMVRKMADYLALFAVNRQYITPYVFTAVRQAE
jgi:hypothetical protein